MYNEKLIQHTRELLTELRNNIRFATPVPALSMDARITSILNQFDSESPTSTPTSHTEELSTPPVREVSVYEKAFKPYCLDYTSTDTEEVRKQKVDFAFNNSDEAFELFQSFYNTNYGSINIDENLISIHTGGWSDNEEIIYEFKKTLWWQKCFRIQITGGHYYFDTDKVDGKKEWDIVKRLSDDSTPHKEGYSVDGWVRVEDGLPEINVDVLVYADRRIDNHLRVFVAWLSSGKQWASVMVDDDENILPTHWQPLPPPPLNQLKK